MASSRSPTPFPCSAEISMTGSKPGHRTLGNGRPARLSSVLLTTKRIGLPVWRISRAIVSSPDARPSHHLSEKQGDRPRIWRVAPAARPDRANGLAGTIQTAGIRQLERVLSPVHRVGKRSPARGARNRATMARTRANHLVETGPISRRSGDLRGRQTAVYVAFLT